MVVYFRHVGFVVLKTTVLLDDIFYLATFPCGAGYTYAWASW